MIIKETHNHVVGIVSDKGISEIIQPPLEDKLRIVVRSIIVQNESNSPVVVHLLDGDVVRWRILMASLGDGISKTFSDEEPWFLEFNSPLNIELSGNFQCNYSIMYDIQHV